MTISCLESNFEKLRAINEDAALIAARERRQNPELTALLARRAAFYDSNEPTQADPSVISVGRTVLRSKAECATSEQEQQQQASHNQ